MTHPVCACIIARDESEFLPGCLASLQREGIPAVVLDTGSVDGTPAIAATHGATVAHWVWTDDFAAARNAALEASKSDWVLLLDADERLHPGAGAAIRAAMQRPEVDCGLLSLHNAVRLHAPLETVVSGELRHGTPVLLPRLFRRTADLRWRGVVHEDVSDWLQKRKERVAIVDAHIVHFGAIPAVRRRLNKRRRNIELLERRLEHEPDNVAMLVHLGNEYGGTGDLDRAWEMQERAWEAQSLALEGGSDAGWVASATLRAKLQAHRGDFEGLQRTMETCDEWSQRYPNGEMVRCHPNLLFYRSLSWEMQAAWTSAKYARLRCLDKAAQGYELALATKGASWTCEVDIGVAGPLSELHLAGALVQLGYFERALELLSEPVRRVDPESAALIRVEALIGLGQFNDAAMEARRWQAVDAMLLECFAYIGLEDQAAARLAFDDVQRRATETWRAPHRIRLLETLTESALDRADYVVLVGNEEAFRDQDILGGDEQIRELPGLASLGRLLALLDRWIDDVGVAEFGDAERHHLTESVEAFIEQLDLEPDRRSYIGLTADACGAISKLAGLLPRVRFWHLVGDESQEHHRTRVIRQEAAVIPGRYIMIRRRHLSTSPGSGFSRARDDVMKGIGG